MATDMRTVRVLCDNLFHRGPDGGPAFSADRARGLAVSEPVVAEKARQLVEDVDGYRCPQLDADDAGEAEAPSSKLDGAPMPVEGTPVTNVKGIGEKTAPDLADAGVTTAEQLLARDAAELAGKVGHSADVVETWQAAAGQLIDDDA